MFNLHITLAMVIAGMQEIIADKGAGHTASTDDGCFYMSGSERSGFVTADCIVGEFFSRLGLLRVLGDARPVDGYHEGFGVSVYDTSSIGNDLGTFCNLGGFNGDVVQDRLASFGVTLDTAALNFLTDAQTVQDRGEAWGSAVESASQSALHKEAISLVIPAPTAWEQAQANLPE